jgi:hypothetical protein
LRKKQQRRKEEKKVAQLKQQTVHIEDEDEDEDEDEQPSFSRKRTSRQRCSQRSRHRSSQVGKRSSHRAPLDSLDMPPTQMPAMHCAVAGDDSDGGAGTSGGSGNDSEGLCETCGSEDLNCPMCGIGDVDGSFAMFSQTQGGGGSTQGGGYTQDERSDGRVSGGEHDVRGGHSAASYSGCKLSTKRTKPTVVMASQHLTGNMPSALRHKEGLHLVMASSKRLHDADFVVSNRTALKMLKRRDFANQILAGGRSPKAPAAASSKGKGNQGFVRQIPASSSVVASPVRGQKLPLEQCLTRLAGMYKHVHLVVMDDEDCSSGAVSEDKWARAIAYTVTSIRLRQITILYSSGIAQSTTIIGRLAKSECDAGYGLRLQEYPVLDESHHLAFLVGLGCSYGAAVKLLQSNLGHPFRDIIACDREELQARCPALSSTAAQLLASAFRHRSNAGGI